MTMKPNSKSEIWWRCKDKFSTRQHRNPYCKPVLVIPVERVLAELAGGEDCVILQELLDEAGYKQ